MLGPCDLVTTVVLEVCMVDSGKPNEEEHWIKVMELGYALFCRKLLQLLGCYWVLAETEHLIMDYQVTIWSELCIMS